MSRHKLNRSLKRLQRTLLAEKYGVVASTLVITLKPHPFSGGQIARWHSGLIGLTWLFRVLGPILLLIFIISLGLACLYVILDNHFGFTEQLADLWQ